MSLCNQEWCDHLDWAFPAEEREEMTILRPGHKSEQYRSQFRETGTQVDRQLGGSFLGFEPNNRSCGDNALEVVEGGEQYRETGINPVRDYTAQCCEAVLRFQEGFGYCDRDDLMCFPTPWAQFLRCFVMSFDDCPGLVKPR